MASHREGTTDKEFLRLKFAFLGLAEDGAFDASDALTLVIAGGLLAQPNAGTVAAMLDDLVDLGELEVTGRTEGDGPIRYQRPR